MCMISAERDENQQFQMRLLFIFNFLGDAPFTADADYEYDINGRSIDIDQLVFRIAWRNRAFQMCLQIQLNGFRFTFISINLYLTFVFNIDWPGTMKATMEAKRTFQRVTYYIKSE